MNVTYLTLNEVVALHELSIRRYGGSLGLRDLGLLESAVAQPMQAAFGEELYPTTQEKAAAYLFFIAKNHAFIDGNKRTALTACKMFLTLNGYSLNLTPESEENLVLEVASGTITKEDVIAVLNASVEKRAMGQE